MQQVNPDYGLDPSLTATFSTHLFMLSASHVQCTWNDTCMSFYAQRAKRIGFLENPKSACRSISWTIIFSQYNMIHDRKMYEIILNVRKQQK